MCCVFAPISGCHLNPAVSIGLWAAGRFSLKEVPSYIIAQVIGGILAATVLYLIATGHHGNLQNGFASNGYGFIRQVILIITCFICEVTMSFLFLISAGVTNPQLPNHFAPSSHWLSLNPFN